MPFVVPRQSPPLVEEIGEDPSGGKWDWYIEPLVLEGEQSKFISFVEAAPCCREDKGNEVENENRRSSTHHWLGFHFQICFPLFAFTLA